MKTIKTNLFTKKNKEISFTITKEIEQKINQFKKLWKSNGYTLEKDKVISMIKSETFASLYTEGEISSRRLIKNVDSLKADGEMNTKLINFRNALMFIFSTDEISPSNVFTLYSTLVAGLDLGESKLSGTQMFRGDKVFIGSNKLKGDYEGFDYQSIPKALTELTKFARDERIDLIIRSIVSHLYFEMIHPFFDYNGRTGRFIPQWIAVHEGNYSMNYFATSIGNYRETYLSLFNKCIDASTYEVNVSRFVSGILDLLIMNQYQYSQLVEMDKYYYEEMDKFLNANQKNILMYFMIKSEKQKSTKGWMKFGEEGKKYVEVLIKQSQLSRDMEGLHSSEIITKTDTKPARYKLNNYKLFK